MKSKENILGKSVRIRAEILNVDLGTVAETVGILGTNLSRILARGSAEPETMARLALAVALDPEVLGSGMERVMRARRPIGDWQPIARRLCAAVLIRALTPE